MRDFPKSNSQLGKPRGEQESEDDLGDVGRDEGDHADQKRMDDGAAHHIDEPQAAAEINESERDRRHEVMRPMRELKERKDEIKERHSGERHDEAARRGEEDGEAAAKSREDGEPHRAAKEIKPYGDGATLPAEIFQDEEDAEDLERERHGRGDRDERTHREERNAEGDMRHVPRLQFSQNVFSHTSTIVTFRRAEGNLFHYATRRKSRTIERPFPPLNKPSAAPNRADIRDESDASPPPDE